MICILYHAGGPSVYWSGVTYFSDSQPETLVQLECRSRNSAPTNVTWLRNNVAVDVDQKSYQTVQIVNTDNSLTQSYYRNILIVNTIDEGLGVQNYTCIVWNTFGSDSEDISVNRECKQR